MTGSDITSKVVSELSHRHPRDRFVELDIGGENLSALAGERFDFVSACAVLYHVVDDAGYERAFYNIHSLLEDDGLFIFSENFPRNKAYRTEIQTVRLEGEILALLDRAGFEVVTRAPIYALMNNPVSSDSRLLRAWWRNLTRVLSVSKAAGPALGAALYPLELALVSLLKRGPSTELVVCRKAGG